MAPKRPADDDENIPVKKVKLSDIGTPTTSSTNQTPSNASTGQDLGHLPRTSVGKALPDISVIREPYGVFFGYIRERYYPQPLGIPNTSGFQCYLNSSLVLLLTSKRFVGYLRGWHMVREMHYPQFWSNPEHAHRLLHAISNELYDGNFKLAGQSFTEIQRAVNTFWRCLCQPDKSGKSRPVRGCAKTNTWSMFGQQDANEFLYWLLGCMRDQLHVDEAAARNFRVLFECNFSRRVICPDCKWRVRRRVLSEGEDSDLMLRLSAPPLGAGSVDEQRKQAVALEECIANHMSETFGKPLRCTRCQNPLENVGKVVSHFRNTPEMLLIALPREKSHPRLDPLTGQTLTADKSHVAISVPETLDITPWLDPTSYGTTANIKYRLHGAVSHCGTHMVAGHYIAHVRNGLTGGFWYRVDDDRVSLSTMASFNDSDPTKYSTDEGFTNCFEPHTLVYELDWENCSVPPGRKFMNLNQGDDADVRPAEWLDGQAN